MRDGREETHSGEPLALLEQVMRDYTPRMALQNSHDIDHNGPGWVVFTSYDLGFHIEPSAGKARKNGPDFPRIFAAFYPWVLVETKDRWTLRVLAKDEGSAITERDSLSERFQSLHLAPCTLHAPSSTPHSSTSRSDYDRAFASVKTAIRDGEIYQANLTQRFVAEGTTDPKSLYKRLCSVSPAPYACAALSAALQNKQTE
ncbi:MAG: chorismate-binding protein [Planctomycetaceae bacterium]|nr:chorismate-binding protein [Planctomycetaceae bacterium]